MTYFTPSFTVEDIRKSLEGKCVNEQHDHTDPKQFPTAFREAYGCWSELDKLVNDRLQAGDNLYEVVVDLYVLDKDQLTDASVLGELSNFVTILKNVDNTARARTYRIRSTEYVHQIVRAKDSETLAKEIVDKIYWDNRSKEHAEWQENQKATKLRDATVSEQEQITQS